MRTVVGNNASTGQPGHCPLPAGPPCCSLQEVEDPYEDLAPLEDHPEDPDDDKRTVEGEGDEDADEEDGGWPGAKGSSPVTPRRSSASPDYIS